MKNEQLTDENVFLLKEEIFEYIKDYCDKYALEYSDMNINKFIEFLRTDIPDWIKENLRYFDNNDD